MQALPNIVISGRLERTTDDSVPIVSSKSDWREEAAISGNILWSRIG